MCTCISCPDCNGSGQVEYRTDSYPETDLETCVSCRGSGVEERCDECDEEEMHD